jgi:hypothetical protein
MTTATVRTVRSISIPRRYRDPLANETPRLALLRKAYRLSPTDEQLSRFRDTLFEGDPLADDVVRALAGLSRVDAHRLLGEAIDHGIDAIDAPPPALRALFRELDVRPAWVDDEKLELATRTTERVGMSGERVLSCICLTGGYRSSAANKPIALTGALESMAYRRLAETAKFTVDLYDSRTLGRKSAGFRGAVMVRVMHAMVRERLARDPRWRADEWGLPVNQSDMLATNLLFSTVYVLGLRALGHIVTKREADALVHFWRYVGFLMGVRLELLPRDFEEARALVYISGASQPPGDEDSKKLATALLSVPVDRDRSPFWNEIDVQIRAGFSRLFLGDREADELGLPNSAWKWVVPLISAWNFGTEIARIVLPGASTLISQRRMARVHRVIERSLEGEAPTYRPYHLRKSRPATVDPSP